MRWFTLLLLLTASGAFVYFDTLERNGRKTGETRGDGSGPSLWCGFKCAGGERFECSVLATAGALFTPVGGAIEARVGCVVLVFR